MADDTGDKHCFVIGPIGDEATPERIHADWLLKGIILPMFKQYFPEWTVERADKIATPGMVSSQIINRLHDAQLVVADLSFHNANAFYEMSLRHKVAKPIIHMIRKGEKIPFDVIPHRAIPFSNATPDDLEAAQITLRAAVTEAIKPGFEPDNPITHARGKEEFEDHASPAMKVLAEEVASLRARMDSFEAPPVRRLDPSNSTHVFLQSAFEDLSRKISRQLLYIMTLPMSDKDFGAVAKEVSRSLPKDGALEIVGKSKMIARFPGDQRDQLLYAKAVAGIPGIQSVERARPSEDW